MLKMLFFKIYLEIYNHLDHLVINGFMKATCFFEKLSTRYTS